MPEYDLDKITKQVGLRIAELRQARGLTQEQFSVRLRNTVQWVSQIEAGANLTVYTLARIANALDVSLTELVVPATQVAVRKRGRPRKQK